MVSANWQHLVEKKRADRDERIPKAWRLPESVSSQVSPENPTSAFDLLKETALLTPWEIDVTENHDATALLEMIAAREISSYDVTLAFCKRAAISHQLVGQSGPGYPSSTRRRSL